MQYKMVLSVRAKHIKNVSSAWVKDQEVGVKNGKVTEYRVKLKITFVLED